jgi:hypothetical protein
MVMTCYEVLTRWDAHPSSDELSFYPLILPSLIALAVLCSPAG